MDLMRARVALRERPLLDVLDLSVRFCAENAAPYAKVSVAILVPAFALSWAAAAAGGWWLGWTAALALAAFADAPFVALASRLVFEDKVRAREALRASWRVLPALFGARMLQTLAVVTSLVLLVLPWLYVGAVLLFCVEVVVLERATVRGAISRAQAIASSRFGTALGAMVVLLAVRVLITLVADVAGREAIGEIFEFRAPPSAAETGGSWLALLGWWSTVPILATARFFTYLDVRTRSEGWDIQTRFAAIATRSAARVAEQGSLS